MKQFFKIYEAYEAEKHVNLMIEMGYTVVSVSATTAGTRAFIAVLFSKNK